MSPQRRVCLLAVICLLGVLVPGSNAQSPSVAPTSTSPAVQAVTEVSEPAKSDILKNVKAATDGIQFALQAAAAKDVSRVLKGIGDALSTLPGKFGFAGIAFSVAASFAAIFGSSGSREDPVLTALNKLHTSFDREMRAIEKGLRDLNTKSNLIIAGIDQILSDISDIPAKVVAEMKLTDVSTMKDKFAHVQRASVQYAHGNLTRTQMMAKCDDFDVAALFSELETILADEKNLFRAKFGALDHANGLVQLQLLLFYISVIPVVSNCNALKYSIESLRTDGRHMDELIKLVYVRATWYLAPADRTIHVRERFNPFATIFDTNGQLGDTSHEWSLALSFKAYSFMPPHGQCFEAVNDGTLLVRRRIAPLTKVTNPNMFCVKAVMTDDAPHRMLYAQRTTTVGDVQKAVSIIQPEVGEDFDPLSDRGWTENVVLLFSIKVGHWVRLPRFRVIGEFLLIQAASPKVSLDEVTEQCRSYGAGFDRDGDGHSKDYGGAPWTIFCVKYVSHSLREIDDASGTFLVDVQWNEMDAGKAWTAPCPTVGYARDKNLLPLPSKVKKKWFGGYVTEKAYAVCLRWGTMTGLTPPNQFLQRVWLDDAVAMRDKPKKEWNQGGRTMTLPPPPTAAELATF